MSFITELGFHSFTEVNKKQVQNQLDISVDCVLFGFDGEGLKVLLIEQAIPESGALSQDQVQLALPGDLVFTDESLDDSAGRVLKQLTSLEGIYLKQFHTSEIPSV